MKKLDETFLSMDEFEVKQYVYCFYYGSTYFKKFTNYISVRNFYKL